MAKAHDIGSRRRVVLLLLFTSLAKAHDSYVDRLGQHLPGLVWGKRLLLLGAEIVRTIQTPEEVHFLMFAIAPEILTLPYGPDPPQCWETEQTKTIYNFTLAEALLPWQNVTEVSLEVVLHGRGDGTQQPRLPMEHLPMPSHDGNQAHTTHIWRANLTGVVSTQSWHRLPGTAALHVSVVHSSRRSSSGDAAASFKTAAAAAAAVDDVVISVSIPLNHGSAAVGLYRTHHAANRPLPANKSATLCTGVRPNAEPYIVEYVAHHLQVGIGHIFLGIFVLQGDPTLDTVRRLLSAEIRAGAVTVVPFKIAGFDCIDTDPLKLSFYHACLHRAKGTSEYVAMWDVDEYWLPNGLGGGGLDGRGDGEITETAETADFSPTAFVDAIRALESPRCPDWCYAVFPSFTALSVPTTAGVRPEDAAPRIRWNGEDYVWREKVANSVWQKSVSRTAAANMGGFHVHGSCTTTRLPAGEKFSADGGAPECIVPAGHRGVMHHFRNMFGMRYWSEKETTKDEYAALYWPRVHARIKGPA